ncbi:TetR family transcriptional regulator [Mycolicibacterium insubricum]|nr:TetR family transcriptional regulator [Mycolicibacterium insubricum]
MVAVPGDDAEPVVPNRDPVLAIVVGMLENEGYDAVQLREVARRARTSLATIYKRYPTRDELILAALQAWTDEHRYAGITIAPRRPGESLHTAYMRLLRTIFEPWERHPEMLTAFFRARSAPGGQRLLRRGIDAVAPAGRELLSGIDENFVADLDNIIAGLAYGLLGRYATGEIAVTDILTTLDRAVYWLTAGYDAAHPGDA